MRKLQVIYGMQYGSEGKGQVAAYLARQHPESQPMLAVRVGGPNAGHTITDRAGIERKLQTIPCAAFVHPRCTGLIGPAGIITPSILLRELKWLGETWPKVAPMVIIDRFAYAILDEHVKTEAHLKGAIGSTGKGVGAATAAKVMRTGFTFEAWLTAALKGHASNEGLTDEELTYLVTHVQFTDTKQHVNQFTGLVQLEGTQGYLLSLNVSGYWPKCTSRDCGPDALIAQVGTNPRTWDKVDVIGVARTFPIRVAGNSGPLPGEVNWDYMREYTNGYIDSPEMTTVTKNPRRIAHMDKGILRRVVRETAPTRIFLTFLDYEFPALADIDLGKPANRDAAIIQDDAVREYLLLLEQDLGQRIDYVSAGPGNVGKVSLLTGAVPDPLGFYPYIKQSIQASIAWAYSQSLHEELPPGVERQVKFVADIVQRRLQEAGAEYGEDVLFMLGEESAILMLAHKILRGLWSVENSLPPSERKDTYLDIAGYAELELARQRYLTLLDESGLLDAVVVQAEPVAPPAKHLRMYGGRYA